MRNGLEGLAGQSPEDQIDAAGIPQALSGLGMAAPHIPVYSQHLCLPPPTRGCSALANVETKHGGKNQFAAKPWPRRARARAQAAL